MPPTSADFGAPYLSEGQGSTDIVHNEGICRSQVLAAGIVHYIRNEPIGDEIEGDVLLIDGVGTGDFADQDNKIAFLFNSGWKFIPNVETDGSDIPIGARHAGLTFYVQDDGSSPPVPVVKRWTGSSWVTI